MVSKLVALGPDITHVVHRPRVIPLHLLVASRMGRPVPLDEVLGALEQRAAPYELNDSERATAERRIAPWLSGLTGGSKPYFYDQGGLLHTPLGERLLSLVGLHALRTLQAPDEQAKLFPASRRRPFAMGTRLIYLEGLLAGLTEGEIARTAAVPQSMIAQQRRRLILPEEGLVEPAPHANPQANGFRVVHEWRAPVRAALQQHHEWASDPAYATDLAEAAMEVALDRDRMRPLAILGLQDFLESSTPQA